MKAWGGVDKAWCWDSMEQGQHSMVALHWGVCGLEKTMAGIGILQFCMSGLLIVAWGCHGGACLLPLKSWAEAAWEHAHGG